MAATKSEPRLLFITPTYPDTQGNGLAMRAGMFVEALARRYRLSLLVVPIFSAPSPSSDGLIARTCAEVTVVAPRAPSGIGARLLNQVNRQPELIRLFAQQAEACSHALGYAGFDVMHAFRLYTSPLALALASSRPGRKLPRLQLDLDDVESTTHGSLAHLYRLNGIVAESAAEERQAALYEEQEGRLLPKFDRVYVCSASDAARISGLVRGELQVLPNAIRPPLTPVVRRTSHPFTFLFVGTLGYFPNEDAVNWFCRDVLPVIREQAPAPFRVRIVGSGMPPSFAALARIEEVRLVGQVQDIAPEYAEADGVIVPIRGGGGTRIKILEAFAYQRPVVSTSAGAEGIDAEAERHLLVGDSASDFAAQSLRLMRDVELRQRLASEAYGLLLAEYSQARANQRLSGTA